MKEAISVYGNLEVDTLTDQDMRILLEASAHMDPKKLPSLSRGLLIAALFEVKAEPHLIEPHHILDHPIETTPLCKPHRNQEAREEGLVNVLKALFYVRKSVMPTPSLMIRFCNDNF